MSYTERLLKIFKQHKIDTLILNASGTSKVIEYKYSCTTTIIATITQKVTKNVYPLSLYALMINYGEDELIKIKSPLLKILFTILIKVFSFTLKSINIDKTHIINNYLFATNSFSKEWENMNIKPLRELALNRTPKHNLIIRSVNKLQNPKLFSNLQNDGWKAIAIRQVYIYNSEEKWLKSRNTKNDKKLFNNKEFSFINSTDYKLAIKLYNSLYLDKYSKHNIQYSTLFLQELVEKNLLKLFFLQDNKTLKIIGVIGVSQEEKSMTVPIIGYDKRYPQKSGLYRILVYQATKYAFEQNCTLNFSSGAPDFKRKRGAKAELEYIFVYSKHMPIATRLVWKVIYLLSKKLYAPMLERLKL